MTQRNKALDAVSEILEAAVGTQPAQDAKYATNAHSALAILTVLRDSHPNLIEGYTQALTILKRLSKFDDAATLVDEAIKKFPRAPWALSEAAALSVERGDYETALTYGERARSSFPQHRAGYIAVTQALRQSKRWDEADACAVEAASMFPDDTWPVNERIRIAQARADWAGVAACCEALRIRQPDLSTGYLAACSALRRLKRFDEAERLLVLACTRFPTEAWPVVQKAWLAHEQNDPEKALRYWAEVRAAFPNNIDSYLAAGRTNLGLSRLDEAEALFSAALERFPDQRDPAIEFAQVAEIKGEFAEADRRWSHAKKAFPSDPEIAMYHASSPASPRRKEAKKDWAEAFARLRRLNDEFPEYGAGYASYIHSLRRSGRLQEAVGIAVIARGKLPRDIEIALETAKVLELAGQAVDAVTELQACLALNPGERKLQAALATSLSITGRHDEADKLCAQALAAAPEPGLLKVHAQIATRRGDVATALERWRVAEAESPNDLTLKSEAAAARFALAEHEVSPAEHVTSDIVDPALSQLMLRFESLGGTAQGCEFGLVQRRLGAEPIGLLRWSAMTLAPLLAALRSGFEGVGEPEQTVLDLYEHLSGEQEYRTSDRRFGMGMHTFIKPDMIAYDKMFAQSCRRLRFLKTRMMEDLAAAEKIFVFKTGDRVHSVEEISELLAALRLHGPNTLLYVRLEDEAHPSGSVEFATDGLMIGYLDHFSQIPGGAARVPNHADWTRICTNALELWKENRLDVAHPAIA